MKILYGLASPIHVGLVVSAVSGGHLCIIFIIEDMDFWTYES